MPVNFVKHIRRLVQKRERLQRQIERKQRELDAVVKQLGTVQAAIGEPAKVSEDAPAVPAEEVATV